jgi:hypothetical protein
VIFLRCKANSRVKLAKTGHGPYSNTLVCICVVRLLFVLFYVFFVCKCVLPPGDNPIAVNKYIIYHSISRPTDATCARFYFLSICILYMFRASSAHHQESLNRTYSL